MDSNMRKVDRNNRVYCNLCKSGLSISADSDLWLHDGIWHRKNSIDYFIKYARADWFNLLVVRIFKFMTHEKVVYYYIYKNPCLVYQTRIYLIIKIFRSATTIQDGLQTSFTCDGTIIWFKKKTLPYLCNYLWRFMINFLHTL